MIILNGKIFREASFINEEELENFVKSHYKIFFGEHSLYTSQFSVSTIGGKTSVPDGIAVDFKNRIWYVIEVELKRHGVWGHIIPQVTKHLVAVSNQSEKEKIVSYFMKIIKESDKHRKMINELGIPDEDIWRELELILNKKPVLTVIIDGIPQDLKEWQSTINIEARIVEVTKYVSEDNEVAYYIPDYMIGLVISPEEDEEEEEQAKPVLTENEFLRICKPQICKLYEELRRIVSKYPGLLALKPTRQGMSFRVKTKERPSAKWHVIFTIYGDSIYIHKGNKENFTMAFGGKVEEFFNTLRNVEAINRVFDIMTQPGVRAYDLTEDDVNTIIEAIEILITKSNEQ